MAEHTMTLTLTQAIYEQLVTTSPSQLLMTFLSTGCSCPSQHRMMPELPGRYGSSREGPPWERKNQRPRAPFRPTRSCGSGAGFRAAKLLFVATEVGLFAHLAAGPATGPDLAARTGIAP